MTTTATETTGDGVAGSVGEPRRWRTRGGLVTGVTVLSLVAGMGLSLLGLGAADHAVASYDAASWLWSQAKGELARANGVTGRVDTRLEVTPARGHTAQIAQNDRFLLLRDLDTGQVSSLDLATLRPTDTTATTSGLGVSVALHADTAFVVDAVQGTVGQLDPATLEAIGEPIHFPPPIAGGTFDGKGRLWIAVPGEGTVAAVTAADSSPSADGRIGPRTVRTEPVAEPHHDLALSTLDDGVAVLDRTTGKLTTIKGDRQRAVQLPPIAPGELPARTTGDAVPVTVRDSRQVYVVSGDSVREIAVPGEGGGLRPAVAWADRFYCADDETGVVHVFDATGGSVGRIDVTGANGPLDLDVRENHLFINAPRASTARVVDDEHRVRVVDKYADDILGGDPPPAPAPPPTPRKPRKPAVTRPGAPRAVTAAAGNAQARVSWRAAASNGAAISRYVVEGGGRTYQVGADQRSVEVTGLTNGETYRFSVHAVNAKGAGPERTSNPVVPTAEVPDPPASVTALARPDGTVLVTWPAANGQGLDVRRYTVTAVSPTGGAPVGEATGTELVIKAGALTYGTQYAFSVVSVNERGAASKASPLSASVVPFAVPGAPPAVQASTVGDQRGAVAVSWQPAVDNGRPVTRYVVQAGDRTVDAGTQTQATVTGLGDDASVTVTVHAVNEAGDGPAASTTARTLAKPAVTVTGSTADFDSVTVSFTVNAGGGPVTCSVKPSGRPAVAGACSRIAVGGLSPSTRYTFTVTATNAAGSGSSDHVKDTAALYGVATCRNGKEGETATYCDRDRAGRNGNEIFEITRQDDDRQAGWAKPGTRLQAYCKKTGESVYAYIYNNEKRSTWWVQVNYGGRNYIPWAWLNLENGDNLNALPTC